MLSTKSPPIVSVEDGCVWLRSDLGNLDLTPDRALLLAKALTDAAQSIPPVVGTDYFCTYVLNTSRTRVLNVLATHLVPEIESSWDSSHIHRLLINGRKGLLDYTEAELISNLCTVFDGCSVSDFKEKEKCSQILHWSS